MKYHIYNTTNTNQTRPRVPAITFYRSGAININSAALTALGNPAAVELLQDAERPQDWYVRAADPEKGFVLRSVKNGTYKTFNTSELSRKLLAALQHTGASVRCPLAQEPTTIDASNWHAILTAANKN